MSICQTDLDSFRSILVSALAEQRWNVVADVLTEALRLSSVIADEAAKSPQPEADGDVPEWLTDYEGKSIDGFDTQAIWDAVNAEISRRVADVAADRDKWIERAGEHAKTIGEQAKRIAFLDEQCSRNQQAYYAMTEERDALKQQLAAAQAEVERLSNTRCHIMSKGDQCVCTLCKQDAEIAKLREEVSRLTRPVDKESIYARWADIGKFISTVNEFASAVAPLLQSERNARESVEAERDELREFVKAKHFWQMDDGLRKKVLTDTRFWPVTDEDIDKGLAAYRAEKGKVGA